MNDTVKHKYTNALIYQTSPYLLQHAHNPVNWYAWGEEPFEKAQIENKLVLVSIGYAACHWCHVMEHKSFENEAIAEIMNHNFVCIKVDREERPDIDQVYMSAIQLLTGSGGWPLNCFVLPDMRPVYGGTYFAPEHWVQVLESLSNTYHENPQRVLDAAQEITQGLKSHELIQPKNIDNGLYPEQVENMYKAWKFYFDDIWGGNKGAPKFPLPISSQFLMQFGYLNKNADALNHLHLSLTKMASGGIYDHLAGGFARYSVDDKWHVPHFEKMLYDNGQLVSLYCNAYKLNKNWDYKNVVNKTLEFTKNELTRPDGAFYASYDADSEGGEGKFYVWGKIEIQEILGKDAEWFCSYYNITDKGNWDNTNILWVSDAEEILNKYNLSKNDFIIKNEFAVTRLLNVRKKRVYPALDDKVLTAWNALMSIGYVDAYEAFGTREYLDTAIKNGQFISTIMHHENGGLYRNNKNQKSTINAFLDDYALTIRLFTKLYQNTFDFYWLHEAKLLLEFTLTHFYNEKLGMFFYTSDFDSPLIVRKTESTDNVIPASNSVMANVLFDLGLLFSNQNWVNISKQMLTNVISDAIKNAVYYANWGILLQKFTHPFYEVVFVGENAVSLSVEFNKHYHPNVLVAGLKTDVTEKLPIFENRWLENETLIYVCVQNTCKLPVKNVAEAIELISAY